MNRYEDGEDTGPAHAQACLLTALLSTSDTEHALELLAKAEGEAWRKGFEMGRGKAITANPPRHNVEQFRVTLLALLDRTAGEYQAASKNAWVALGFKLARHAITLHALPDSLLDAMESGGEFIMDSELPPEERVHKE